MLSITVPETMRETVQDFVTLLDMAKLERNFPDTMDEAREWIESAPTQEIRQARKALTFALRYS